MFFILSMAVLTLYWVWFAYLKYGKGESEASKEVNHLENLSVLEINDSSKIQMVVW